MALLNLDNIILHCTVLGPQCPGCGAGLQVQATAPRPRWKARLLRFLPGPKPKQHYHCGNCRDTYGLMKLGSAHE